jgi:hypothetical protein
MQANIKYFSDWNGATIEVTGTYSMKNSEFALLFPGVKGLRFDSFSKRVARAGLTVVPLTRVIEYKKNPSLHQCNDRCLGAKPNGCCECRCGGANHGKGRV